MEQRIWKGQRFLPMKRVKRCVTNVRSRYLSIDSWSSSPELYQAWADKGDTSQNDILNPDFGSICSLEIQKVHPLTIWSRVVVSSLDLKTQSRNIAHASGRPDPVKKEISFTYAEVVVIPFQRTGGSKSLSKLRS